MRENVDCFRVGLARQEIRETRTRSSKESSVFGKRSRSVFFVL